MRQAVAVRSGSARVAPAIFARESGRGFAARVLPPLFASGVVAALSLANGAYFPVAWGWSALVLLWAAAIALLVRPRIATSRLELVFLTALASFVAWVGASAAWSIDVAGTVLEVERDLVYVAGVAAILLVFSRNRLRALLGAVSTAVVVACAYGLATRIFPERLGTFDPVAPDRLAEPIGYWNGLGIFAVFGLVLAFVFAVRARTLPARALAAASLPVLALTLFFTFGRGPWIALAIGAVVTILVDRNRLELVAALLTLAPLAGVAVWLASRSEALTTNKAPLPDATREGHRLALALVVLGLASAALAFARSAVATRFTVGRRARAVLAASLGAALVTALVIVIVRFGGPVELVNRGYAAFKGPPVGVTAPGTDLSARLFSFSGNGRAELWRAAWEDYRAHSPLGSGAGSYEEYWLENRPFPGTVRDAHGLYIEVLAELGPIGLVLLAIALAVPLVAVPRARHRALASAATGSYAAFLFHAGTDWDWEVPAVTLTALLLGASLLVAARRSDVRELSTAPRAGALLVVVVIGAFALIGLVGNEALARGERALAAGHAGEAAAHARKASRWAPWSSAPWRLLADSQIERGDARAARKSLRRALEKSPRDSELWYRLALITAGGEQRRALARSLALNPLNVDAVLLREGLSPRTGG